MATCTLQEENAINGQHAVGKASSGSGKRSGVPNAASMGIPSMATARLPSMGTPSKEKEDLRQKMEAIAREAADIQRELDGSAAPSLRARLNAAAALGRPVPSQQDAPLGNAPAAVAAAATDAALAAAATDGALAAAAAAAAMKPPRPDGWGPIGASREFPGTDARAAGAEGLMGYAATHGGSVDTEPFAATPARPAVQARAVNEPATPFSTMPSNYQTDSSSDTPHITGVVFRRREDELVLPRSTPFEQRVDRELAQEQKFKERWMRRRSGNRS
ncbi:hypothetical protein WJX84_000541 [Apatococcus fuscideae]